MTIRLHFRSTNFTTKQTFLAQTASISDRAMLTFSFASSMDKIRTEKFVYVCFGERADAFPCSPPQQSPKILEGIFGIRQTYIASKSHPPHTEQESQKLSNDERTSADVEHACALKL